MAVFRVITRIIPLNSSESTFEPATFDQLTDGDVGEVKVLNLTEPQSGIKYRIERIGYMVNVGPGETVESMNNAYAEKLKSIPGFTELKAGDMPLNPYDKSFQLTLPKVLLGKESDSESSSDSQQSKSSGSFKISVVKNLNFKKASPKKNDNIPVIVDVSGNEKTNFGKKISPVKKTVTAVIPDILGKEKTNYNKNTNIKKKTFASTSPDKSVKAEINNNKLKLLQKSLSDAKALFRSKYPSYLSKKIKKSVWKKNTSPRKSKSPVHSNSKKIINGFSPECPTSDRNMQNITCPTSNFMKADYDLDVRKTLDSLLDGNFQEGKAFENGNEPSTKRMKVSITDDEETDFTDNSLDSDCGTLVINVPEVAEATDKNSNKDEEVKLKISDAPTRQDSSTTEDSLFGDSFNMAQQTDSSEIIQSSKNNDVVDDDNICKKYVISENHPAHDLLEALKKYFLNGECLICGFIPEDKDYNACLHMESHIISNSFASSYKCSCCDEKFSDPRNMYMHALSREKTYNYICSICTLKFKRRHYLLRHTTKSH